MNWFDAEEDLYNQALMRTEACNKAIARVYLTVQREIADELKDFYDTLDPTWSEAYQAQRLSEIFRSVNQKLEILTKTATEEIESAFLDQYRETFNTFNYNLSGYYAQPGAFPMLPFTMPDDSAVMSALNSKVGAYSFPDSMGYKQDYLQQALRESVAVSIAKGEGVNQLTARLMENFQSGISSYMATARTEMLRAYSLAQLESYKQAEEMGIEFSTPLWLGRNDGRERESHIALNNTYAKLNESDGKYYFHAGGCRGVSPRLFTGLKSAAMNINCRCRMIRVPFNIDITQKFPTIETEGQAPGTGIPDYNKYLEMIS